MAEKSWMQYALLRALRYAALVAVALVAGYLLGARRRGGPEITHEPAREPDSPAAAEPAKSETWYCAMDPQIRRDQPGKCPLCGMDLVPVPGDADEAAAPRELKLSPAARALAGTQVTPVERAMATRDVFMVGKVDYDETRVATITAWVPGRLDRLFVDYTGLPVRQGDHMVSLYSPEIVTTQKALLQARETVQKLEQSDVSIVRETARATVDAARDRLRLWGLTAAQIAEIEQRGTPADHITINAPASGIVVHKNAVQGMSVQKGTRLYTIADLRYVWVKLDAYESDLAWLRYAQTVEFTTEAYPGETFRGRISFIDPVLTDATRTVKVRVNVANPAGRLKPGMFVRATVSATLATGARIVAPDLAGKWISPMHPEIVHDEPGDCDVCGMPLVKAETLGFVTADAGTLTAPLVIPRTAPLISGRRAVVYVQVPGEPARFEGREIVLGQRAGNRYVVEHGLEAGELVVTHGSFKLDSALQIQAKPSMMNPADDVSSDGHGHAATQPAAGAASHAPEAVPGHEVPTAFTTQFAQVLDAYLATQEALADDDFGRAQTSAKRVLDALATVDMSLLSGPGHMAWMKSLGELRSTADAVAAATGLEPARKGFALLSESMAAAVQGFGSDLARPVFQAHCPMAFDNRGASWLQDSEQIRNPYFGDAMLQCGEVTGRLTSAPDTHGAGEPDHD